MTKIKNTQINIRPGFLIAISLILFFNDTDIFFAVVLSILAHEAGHLLALRLGRAEISRIDFTWAGCRIAYAGQRLSYGWECLCAAAGPLCSLLLSFIGAAAARLGGGEIWYFFSGMNAVLFAFNMLPVRILDGGRILYALIARGKGESAAEKAAEVADSVTLFLISIAGLALFITTGGNFLLLLPAIFFIIRKRR